MGRKIGDKDRGTRSVEGGRKREVSLTALYQSEPEGKTRFDIEVDNVCLRG